MDKKKKFIIIGVSSAIIVVIAVILIVILINNNSNTANINTNTVKNEVVSHKPSDDAIISQGKLPNNKLVNLVPQITAGTIGDVIEAPSGVSINILNLELEEYQNYIALTQQAGFVNDTQSESSTNTILYASKNSNGVLIRTSYSAETKKMSLVISQE